MLVIKVKDNESIEKALKRFKKKFEKTKVLRQLRQRSHYVKPSVENRKRKIKEQYKQAMYAKENYQVLAYSSCWNHSLVMIEDVSAYILI